MLKNFLVSKVSVLALTAIVLHSLIVPVWSMKEGDEENRNSAIPIKSLHYNDEKDHFTDLPLEIQVLILNMTAFDLGKDRKGLINLANVCKNWNRNIINNTNGELQAMIRQSWIDGRCGRNNIISPQDQEIFSSLYKGKLIYRPNPESDEGMVVLCISNLQNPLEGTFDLSPCGDAGQYLSINTGYRKEHTPANAGKVEIWFVPWFLVDKEMPQLASNHHIRASSRDWDAARAPIGVFWTWGGWNASDHLSFGDYLLTESMDELGTENLLKKYLKASVTRRRVQAQP